MTNTARAQKETESLLSDPASRGTYVEKTILVVNNHPSVMGSNLTIRIERCKPWIGIQFYVAAIDVQLRGQLYDASVFRSRRRRKLQKGICIASAACTIGAALAGLRIFEAICILVYLGLTGIQERE